MKTYKITVTEIETKEVPYREWKAISADENGRNEYGYVTGTSLNPVETEIYSQSTTSEIDLKGVIDAFNKVKDQA